MPHLRADETVACALRDSDAGVLTLAEWQRDIVEELRSSADCSAPTAPE